MEIRVEITKVFCSDKPTKAFADVFIDNSFVIHGVRLYEKDGRRIILMPTKRWTDTSGERKWRDIAHPISSSARNQIKEAVCSAYEKHLLNGDNHSSMEGGNENVRESEEFCEETG